MQGVEQVTRGGKESCLTVRLGSTLYAIPAGRVQRVIRALAIHPVPQAPSEVLGLAAVGSEPVLVLDLASLAGHGTFNPGEHPLIVVVRAGSGEHSRTVGLAVDDALQLVTFEWGGGDPGTTDSIVQAMQAGERDIYRVNLANIVFAEPAGA